MKAIDVKPTKSKKQKVEDKKAPAKKEAQKKNGKEVKDEKEDTKMVKVQGQTTGGAMVDHCVPNASDWTVYSVPNKVYSEYLMVSDCNRNNNKYYLIQVL